MTNFLPFATLFFAFIIFVFSIFCRLGLPEKNTPNEKERDLLKQILLTVMLNSQLIILSAAPLAFEFYVDGENNQSIKYLGQIVNDPKSMWFYVIALGLGLYALSIIGYKRYTADDTAGYDLSGQVKVILFFVPFLSAIFSLLAIFVPHF